MFQGRATDKVILFYGLQLSADCLVFMVLIGLYIEAVQPQSPDFAALVDVCYAILVVSGLLAFTSRQILPLWPWIFIMLIIALGMFITQVVVHRVSDFSHPCSLADCSEMKRARVATEKEVNFHPKET